MNAPDLTQRLLFHAHQGAGMVLVHVVQVDGRDSRIAFITEKEGATTTRRMVIYEGTATIERYLSEEPYAELALPTDRLTIMDWLEEHQVVRGVRP